MSKTSTALVSTPAENASNAVAPPAKSTAQLTNPLATNAQSIFSTPARSASSPVSTAAAAQAAAPPPPSPGTFRHPRLTEIIERQSKNTITERDVRNAAVNGGVVLLSLIFSGTLHMSLNAVLHLIGIPDAASYTSVLLLLLRILLVLNTVVSLRPMFPYLSRKDDVTDIPLTPAQRSLLGLSPSTSSTPTSAVSGAFITPPRYRRSSGSFTSPQSLDRTSTPTTDRRSISANYSSSPLSTSRYTVGFSPSPAQSLRRTASGSPFSASPAASPLLHKAVTQSHHTQDLEFNVSRSSFGGASTSSTGFGLSRSQSVKERGAGDRRESGGGGRDREFGGTPTATHGKRSSIGVNYKWLYDKGGRLPRSESLAF